MTVSGIRILIIPPKEIISQKQQIVQVKHTDNAVAWDVTQKCFIGDFGKHQ
jgi:hypothetical protein